MFELSNEIQKTSYLDSIQIKSRIYLDCGTFCISIANWANKYQTKFWKLAVSKGDFEVFEKNQEKEKDKNESNEIQIT